MRVLGLSAFYHDSAAALVVDGEIVAAAQEERFSRRKGDERFPTQAIQFCLQSQNLKGTDVDAVVFYEKPWLTFERILDDLVVNAPFGFENFRHGLGLWYGQKFFMKQRLRRQLREGLGRDAGRILKFSQHHLSHAASAFYPSPFESAAVLTIDGVGEWATCTIGHGRGRDLQLLREMRYPHSWGLYYAAVTQFLGFKVNSGEYKVMGLAPYAEKNSSQVSQFLEIIKKSLLKMHADGSLTLNLDYFDFRRRGRMIDPEKWSKLFGIAPRVPESLLKLEHANLAFALQSTLEEGVLRLARHAREITGESRLVMSGGVALNCAANGRLVREKIFDEVWIQPAAGDAGGALGAALAYSHLALKIPRHVHASDGMHASALGPAYSDSEIENELRQSGLKFSKLGREELLSACAERLHQGQIAAWFQGPNEWGPRALGHRSILARANDPGMQVRLNVAVKFRETFRPFAPIVTESAAPKYFEAASASPYMLFTYPVRDSLRAKLPDDYSALSVDEKLRTPRGALPAITHMDFSARIQTVNPEQDARMHGLLETYARLSGHPVLINTSFNRRGEPIVCSPRDAIDCFTHTGIDFMAMGNFLVEKVRKTEG